MTDIYQLKRCVKDLAGAMETTNEVILRLALELGGHATIEQTTEAVNHVADDLADLQKALLEMET